MSVSGGVIMNGNAGWAGLETSDPNLYGTSDCLLLADGPVLPGSITLLFASPVNAVSFDIINGKAAARFTATAYDSLDAIVVDVPEPGTLAMLGLGLVGLGLGRRRKSA